MTPHIRQLEKLLNNTGDKKERERIQKLIDKATRDAQKVNAANRKMAKEIAKIEENKRAMDTQRKIVAGAIVLSHMEHDETFKATMGPLLRQFAEKRYWFHFPEVFSAEEIEQAKAEVEAQRKQSTAEESEATHAGDGRRSRERSKHGRDQKCADLKPGQAASCHVNTVKSPSLTRGFPRATREEAPPRRQATDRPCRWETLPRFANDAPIRFFEWSTIREGRLSTRPKACGQPGPQFYCRPPVHEPNMTRKALRHGQRSKRSNSGAGDLEFCDSKQRLEEMPE